MSEMVKDAVILHLVVANVHLGVIWMSKELWMAILEQIDA